MILVSIPYYNSEETLSKAVDSILNQSYRNFKLLIINDGDPNKPREFIKPHPKIIFHDFEENHGRYFADAVAVEANPYRYYLPADADDYSHKDRLKLLKRAKLVSKADAVFHSQRVISRSGRSTIERYPLLNKPPGLQMKHLAHHSALYRTDVLKSVGSYHPDFRVGYDTLMVNLIHMKYKHALINRVLYTRYIRNGSLTTSPKTGFNSSHRRQAISRLNYLYRKCLSNPDNIEGIIKASIKQETLRQVQIEAEKLKEKLW